MFRVVFVALMLVVVATGYTFRERMDTSSGACRGEGWGPIPVGEQGYDDARCHRITCGRGIRNVAGCGSVAPPTDPKCKLVKGTGHYPDCCPKVQCSP